MAVIRTVKAAGGDYTLLSEWEADASTQFDATEPWEVHCDAFTCVDSAVYFNNWSSTPTDTNRVTVKPADGHHHNGVWDAGFILQVTDFAAPVMRSDIPYVYIEGIQLRQGSDGNGSGGIRHLAIGELTDLLVENTNALYRSTAISGENDSLDIVNCVGRGFSFGFNSAAFAEPDFYFCTAVDNVTGFYNTFNDAGFHYNCVGYDNSTADFNTESVPLQGSHNASGDLTAPGTNVVTGVSAADFVDYAGGDYTAESGGLLDGAGITLASYPQDIAGNTRPEPPSIGAYEPVASDVAPIVEAGGPYSGDVGQPTQLDGSYTHSGAGLLFDAPLQTSIVPVTATGDPTYIRSSDATFTDWEGIVRTVPDDCPRFQGARMVWNRASSSEDFSAPEWLKGGGASITGTQILNLPSDYSFMNTDPLVSVEGLSITASSVLSGSGTVHLQVGTGNSSDASRIQVTLTSTPTRYEVTHTLSADNASKSGPMIVRRPGDTATQVTISNIQCEDVTGQADKTASEYVSNGVISDPYHGANVDGIKFFDTDREGNPLDQTHFACDEEGPYGYISESQVTNFVQSSEDFTTWWNAPVRATITPDDIAAPDGALTADRLQQEAGITTAGNVNQFTPTGNGNTCTYSVWAKAGTGTWLRLAETGAGDGTFLSTWFNLTNGTIGTTDPLHTPAIEAYPNGWYRCSITATNHANRTGGTFTIYLSLGDGTTGGLPSDGSTYLYIWGAQSEVAEHPTTYIKSAGAETARQADVLTYPSTGNINAEKGYLKADVSTFWESTTASARYAFGQDSNTRWLFLRNDADAVYSRRGTQANSGTSDSMYLSVQQASVSWSEQDDVITPALNGLTALSRPITTSPTVFTLGVGCRASGAEQMEGTIRNVTIFDEVPPTIQWTIKSGGTGTFSDANSLRPTFTPDNAATYELTLTVTPDGGIAGSDDATLTATGGVVPPTDVEAGGPYSGTVATAIQLSGSFTPGSDTDPTLTWSIVSGGTGTFSDASITNPTFTPDDVGSYVLRFTVDPDDDSAVTDDAALESEAIDPTNVEAGGPYSGPVGQATAISGSFTPGSDPTPTVLWSVQSGVTGTFADANSLNTTFTPDTIGSSTLLLTVTPTDGGNAVTDTASFNSEAIPPANVEAGGPYSGGVSSAIQLAGSYSAGSDPAPVLLWTIVSGGTGTFSDDSITNPTFTPDQVGPYVLRFSVDPDDGPAVTDDANLSSGTVAPTDVEAGGPYGGDVSTAIQLSGSYTPGSDPSPTLLWSVVSGGTGTFSDNSITNPTFTPDVVGAYVLRFSVDPSDGAAVTDDANLDSRGTAPTDVEAGGPYNTQVGVPVAINGSFTPGSDPTPDVLWSVQSGVSGTFGDATALSTTFTPSAIGSSVLRLTITPTDGGSASSDTATVTITNVPPTDVSANGPYVGAVGQPTQLSGTFTPGSAGAHTFQWANTSGKTGTFSDATVENPTFTPDEEGTYTLTFTVDPDDGDAVTSAPASLTVPTSGQKTVRVKVGGVWVEAVPYVKDGGVFKECEPFIKDGGVWKGT